MKNLGLAIVGMAVLLSIAPVVPYVAKRIDEITLQRKLALEERDRQVQFALIREEKTGFLQHQVNPILQETSQRNHEALTRAKETLANSIERYRSGIEPFISDLRSWSTEYGIISKSIVGWWYKDGRLDAFMGEKFAAHLFTDKSIAADVAKARRQLLEDIEANQNRLLVELTHASTSLKMKAPLAWPESEAFSKDVSTRARAFVGQSTILYEAGSNVTGVLVPVAVDLAIQAAARTAAARAGSAVLAEAGTLAAGAGEGGAAGSEVPVVGNVIGFGVGLFISYLAMSYEQSKADDSLRRSLNNYIDALRTDLIGSEGAPSEISRSMDDYVRQIDDAEEHIITQDVMALNSEPAK